MKSSCTCGHYGEVALFLGELEHAEWGARSGVGTSSCHQTSEEVWTTASGSPLPPRTLSHKGALFSPGFLGLARGLLCLSRVTGGSQQRALPVKKLLKWTFWAGLNVVQTKRWSHKIVLTQSESHGLVRASERGEGTWREKGRRPEMQRSSAFGWRPRDSSPEKVFSSSFLGSIQSQGGYRTC